VNIMRRLIVCKCCFKTLVLVQHGSLNLGPVQKWNATKALHILVVLLGMYIVQGCPSQVSILHDTLQTSRFELELVRSQVEMVDMQVWVTPDARS
jgi:hypothetical protein